MKKPRHDEERREWKIWAAVGFSVAIIWSLVVFVARSMS